MKKKKSYNRFISKAQKLWSESSFNCCLFSHTEKVLLFLVTFHLINIQTHEYNHYSSTTLWEIKTTYMPRRKARADLKGCKEHLPAKHQYDSLIYTLHPSRVNNTLTLFLETIKEFILHIWMFLRTQPHNQVPCYLAILMTS